MTDQEQPDRDPYEPEINDRGMAYMPALDGIGGEAVRVHDSSLAGTDAVWLYIDTTAGDKTGAQLPFTEAFKLASQIYTLAERRGYPVPVPVVPRTRRDVKLGDPVNVTNPDGSSFTATIRTLSEDGTFTAVGNAPESAPAGLPLGHEFTPLKGMLGNPLDECCHRADGTELTRCGYPRAEHETAIDNAVTERFERVDDNIASLADRLEYLERCYREVPRPQDVGMMAAHLAKIERLESELAEARREINAHKDVLGQVGAEKRKLEAQLEAHHQHDADPRRAVDIVKVNRDLTRQLHEAQRELGGMRDRERAVDTLIESVVDGKIRLAEWVDPETPAGRVYELIATLLRQAHDAERQGDAGALENVEAAVTTYERGDNPLEIGLPDGTLAVRIALALHNSRQRITELEREMTAITDYVADIAPGDDDDTPLTRVRAAVDTVVMRANGHLNKLRQVDVVMNKFAEGGDPHAVLPLEIGSVPARVAEFLAVERHARLHEVGEPQHTVVDTSHYFGLAPEGEADTDE